MFQYSENIGDALSPGEAVYCDKAWDYFLSSKTPVPMAMGAVKGGKVRTILRALG